MNPHQIFVPGMGNRNASIVLLGEGPFTEEIKVLKPFVGPSGNFLDSLLAEAGIDRGQCWVTNVSKYMVPPNAKGGRQIPFPVRAQSVGIDLNQQLDWLRTELTSLPNLTTIIALGGTALWALTGKTAIQKYRGSILNGWGFKVIPTYHPAHLLHQSGEVKGFWNKPVMVHDLKRGKEESGSRQFNLPYRNLNVCKSSNQLLDFVSRSSGLSVAVDIEATNCIPVCIGLSVQQHEGLTIPLWNVHGISSVSDSELILFWKILGSFLSSSRIIGQNFGYDRDKIRRLGFTIGSLHSDTMLKAFALHPELPKNLGFLTSIYTREPYYKDEGMYEGSIDDLLLGCARDACVTKEIDDVLEDQLIELGTLDLYRNFILPLHDVYFYNETFTAIEQNGFDVNEDYRKELIHKYIEQDERIRYEMFQIAGENVNCYAYGKIGKLLYEKLNLPQRAGTGEEILTQLINSPSVKNKAHKRLMELILENRRVRRTLDSYLYAVKDFDGRMRTTYYLCLETGRSATQQQEPPTRPWVHWKDGSVKKKQGYGMAFQTITKHGDIGSDVRRMLIADPGEIFLQADSSQAEARVIFKLARDEEALMLMDQIDYHALTATWFFGGKIEDYDKKILGYEHPIRFAGKTLRHAGHLGQGKRGAATAVNTDCRKYKIPFSISEGKAGLALETFHKRQPKIRGIFHAEIVKCLEKNRRLIAPVPYGIDAKVGGTRIFFERWGDELNRQAFSYIPQRTVSENTKAAAMRVVERASWIRILVESHDALLVSVAVERAQEAALILKEEMERPIDFSTCSLSRGELVIPCDVESGYNYKDLSKFKWVVKEGAA